MKSFLILLSLLLSILIYGCGPECSEIIQVEQELKDLPNVGATFYKKINLRKKWISMFNKMGVEKYNSCSEKIFTKIEIDNISNDVGGIKKADLEKVNNK